MEYDKLKWKLYSTIGSTSMVYYAIGHGKELIKKEYRSDPLYLGSGPKEAFDNEVAILKKLSKYSCFPTILHADKNKRIIFMTYSGPSVYKGNQPRNYIEQLNEILTILERENILYKDFKLQHLRIKSGIVSLIDFGASTEEKQKIGSYYRVIDTNDLGLYTHLRL